MKPAVFRSRLRVFLETIVLVLMVALAVIVVVGVGFRKAGASLVWYDEVASIMLAWLTYYGAALAALSRSHIGMPTLVDKMHGNLRKGVVLFGEVVVIAFFSVLAWAGVRVLSVLGGTTLVSLPWVPTAVAQSVIPIGAVLFIVSQLLSLPDALREPVAEPDEEFAYVATAEADGPASSGADA
ncbi:MAG: TRAP transporter small permease [Longimicrobiales bacterium]